MLETYLSVTTVIVTKYLKSSKQYIRSKIDITSIKEYRAVQIAAWVTDYKLELFHSNNISTADYVT